MKPKTKTYRFLEMIPGLLIWTTFILSIVLSFVKPTWVMYFIIVFSLYWLFKVIYFSIYITLSWKRYHQAVAVNWLDKVKEIPDWQRIYHLVFLPTYKEPLEILETTFQGLTNTNYPLDKFIIVLAGEERDRENFLNIARQIKDKYADRFFRFIITIHPDNIAGELKGKGANCNYAGWKSKELIDQLQIPYENIIVSNFDVDTTAHKEYFAHLTYKFLTNPKPTRTSYQPVVFYNNNIWDSPAAMRVVAFGTTFWLMTELARPERLFTFSSHSMSYKALVDVGFWQNDMVSEDSRIFLQCFIKYDGDYTVTPLYVPVSMDTVLAKTYWSSFVNLYKQQRRWAWGVEHFPFLFTKFFLEKNNIPLKKRIYHMFNLIEGMVQWATAPILLFLLGRLPFWVASSEVKATVLAQATPFILQYILSFAMLGIIISAAYSVILLPRRPKHASKYTSLIMVLQWLLLPITLIIFGSLPAVDAQTRMMLGRYLGFWVTEKTRKGV